MRIRAHAVDSLLRVGLPLLVVLLPGPGGAYKLSDVSLTRSTGEATLEIVTNGELRYDLFQLDDPARVVLDVIGAELPVAPVVSGEDQSAWIVDVRHALWKDLPGEAIIRYVIETETPAEYETAVEGSRLRLRVARDLPGSIGEPGEPIRESGSVEKPGSEPLPESEGASDPDNPLSLSATSPEAAPPVQEPWSGPPHPVALPDAGLPGEHNIDLAPPLGKTDPSYVIAGTELASFSRTNPEGGGTPMSLDVQGADVRTVLRSIAEFGKVNIIADVDVVGPMSVRLVDVPWRQALDLVCESSGLVAAESRDVIRVATRRTLTEEELDRESNARKREDLLPLQTEVFEIQYANAEELSKSVNFILSKRGKAEADTRTNSVLVTDIADRIEATRELVRDLDQMTQQVEIVAKLVDVDAVASRQLGISWNVDNLHSNPERLSGSIGHKSGLVSATTELRVGVVRDFADIDATIEALERANKANIVSNPSITTVNNRQARILVGKEVPLIVLDESGNPVTELKKVGITLEVTPYINSESRVTMDLHPEVSDLSSQATVQGGIVFTTTEADTRVMVGDGETAVIGGLIRTNETRFEEGIPVLRGIPVLGNLFKSSDVRKERRELLIFVTPHIVTN